MRWRRAIRSRRVPAEARARLALRRGELVLAVGYGHEGNCTLVATDRALHYQTGTGTWSRLGWELMTGLAWDTAGSRLVITARAGTAPLPAPVPSSDCGPLLEVARERITHTKLGCWTLMLDGQRRVLAEARRRPVTGELLWIVSPRDGTDLGNRHTRRQIGIAVAQLREELGIAHVSHPGQAAAAWLPGPGVADQACSARPAATPVTSAYGDDSGRARS